VIALHSPYGVAETGLLKRPPEKNAAKLAAALSSALSPDPVLGKIREIAPISRNLQ
jgi:hypothetical protein